MIDLKKLRESKGFVLAIVNTKTGEYRPINARVARVIRCEDCKKWEQERRDPEYGDCMYHLSLTHRFDYCSRADRREE